MPPATEKQKNDLSNFVFKELGSSDNYMLESVMKKLKIAPNPRIRGLAKSRNFIWLLHKTRTGNAGKKSCVKVSLLYYNLHQRQFLQQVIFHMTIE